MFMTVVVMVDRADSSDSVESERGMIFPMWLSAWWIGRWEVVATGHAGVVG